MTVAAFALIASGCGKINDIKITSCQLDSITPQGLRGIKACVLAGVDNPSMSFTINDISGSIYYKGEKYLDYTADPVTINKKSSDTYPVNCEGRVAKGVSVFSILSAGMNFDKRLISVDINATIKAKSMKKKLKLSQVPLEDIEKAIKLQKTK